MAITPWQQSSCKIGNYWVIIMAIEEILKVVVTYLGIFCFDG